MNASGKQTVSYSSLTAWLYALSLTGYPITALIVNALASESRPLSMAFRAVFLGLSLTAILLIFKAHVRVLRSSFWIFYLTFWTLYSFRLVYDTQFSHEPLGIEPQVYLWFLFGVTLIPSFAFCRTLDLKTCTAALRRTAILLLLCQLGFYLSADNDLLLSAEGARLGIETLNPISFGVLGAASLCIGVYIVMTDILERIERQSRASYGMAMVIIGYTSIAAGLATVFLAGSRGPVFGLVVVLSLLLIRGYMKTRTKLGLVTIAIISLVVIAILVIPLTMDLGASIVDRFDRTRRGEELSDSFRFFLWESGWSQFLDSPIVGSGIEEKVMQYYPHNLPLEALMATGVVGGALWLGMCFFGTKKALEVMWKNPLFGWIPMIFILMFANSIFSGSLWGAGSLAHFMVASFAVFDLGAPAVKRRLIAPTHAQLQHS